MSKERRIVTRLKVSNFVGTNGQFRKVIISDMEEGFDLQPYGMFAVEAPTDDQFDSYIFRCGVDGEAVCEPVEENVHHASDDLVGMEAVKKFYELRRYQWESVFGNVNTAHYACAWCFNEDYHKTNFTLLCHLVDGTEKVFLHFCCTDCAKKYFDELGRPESMQFFCGSEVDPDKLTGGR